MMYLFRTIIVTGIVIQLLAFTVFAEDKADMTDRIKPNCAAINGSRDQKNTEDPLDGNQSSHNRDTIKTKAAD